ncbi:MAG: hypothetical protein NVS3B20_12430 [Polyangiales bacterium]
MRFAASVVQEGNLFIAQCLEVDVASQGATEEEALANLGEALALYFDSDTPPSTRRPHVRHVEVNIPGNA